MNIAVIGTVFTDIKGYPFGELIRDGRNAGKINCIHGGVGRNIAEDLGRLGIPVRFVSLVNPDSTGAAVLNRLSESGVDNAFVRASRNGMGTWMAVFDNRGEVVVSLSSRPDLSSLAVLIEENHEALFGNADSVILEMDLGSETLEKVFYYAEKYRRPVFACFSVMSIALKEKKYFPLADCLICNLQEAEMLFGEELVKKNTETLPGEDPEVLSETLPGENPEVLSETLPDQNSEILSDPEPVQTGREASLLQQKKIEPEENFTVPHPNALRDRLAVLVKKAGYRLMIVTLGENGAVYAFSDGGSGYCPAEQVKVVDSTGAGDAFCAGVAAALTMGMSLDLACRAGTRLAASVVTSPENVCPPLERAEIFR